MNKYAVLIGNSLFPDEPKLSALRCPENDVKGMQDILEDTDFGGFNSVVPLLNKSLNEITGGIHDVLNKASNQDLVVLYYSGHGKLSKKTGSLYLTTFGTKLETLIDSALAISQIQTYISESNCNKVVLILDCCYSGAAIIKGDIESILQSNSRGFYTITASTEFQPAIETEEYSLFTKYLINGIKTGEADYDKDGKISVIDLYSYANVEVLFDNPNQMPTKSVIGGRGELIISKSGYVSTEGESKKADDLVKLASFPLVNEKLEILKIIQKEASYRPVVPFLGAGISISAGFPTTKFIVQYLAKVYFAIKYGVFEDRFPKLKDTDNPKLEMYRQHPSRYLEDFGWPSLGQLNADIWDWLGRPVEDEKLKLGQKIILEASRKEQGSVNKNHFIDLLAYDIVGEEFIGGDDPYPLKLRDFQQAIVQWVLRKEQSGYENGTSHAVLKEWIRWKEHYNSNDVDNEIEPKPVLLHGDWEMLLDSLCEDKTNLTDTLFTSFENGLNPTLSHRYLAFLQPKLGIDLLLTTNFDSLLERSFQQEGISPKIFDIHKNAGLPNADLIDRQLSLLKLHGSTYGLRFGEQIKYSSETHSDNNSLAHTPKDTLIPKDALILVMGFNGSERSIMQMLHDFVQAKESSEEIKPRLIWIQGPGEPSPLVDKLIEISNAKAQEKAEKELSLNELPVQRLNVKHIDTFIQELFFYITFNSYQASSMRYSSIPNRPLATGLKRFPEKTQVEKETKRCAVQLCIAEIKKGNPSSSWSSLAGMSFVNSLDSDYTVLWIDFENHHTVEGIIAEIFKLVRILDPQAPFCAITDMDNESHEIISKEFERIIDFFKRGRYVLVLDLVESFGRPQMVHHGMISTNNEDYIKQLEDLEYFLHELFDIDNTKKPYWDSYVVVTADMPRLRHLRHLSDNNSTEENVPRSYEKMFALLSKISKESKKCNHINVFNQTPNSRYSDVIESDEFTPDNDLPKNLLRHWSKHEGTISIQDSNERSLSRTENAFLFLETIRSSDSAEDKVKKLSEKGATNAFICVLSVFRRPRSLPLLRSFIERWGLRQIGTKIPGKETLSSVGEKDSLNTHRAINEWLHLIETNVPDKDGNQSPFGVVSQNHEGGVVWLFREAYEATYDALTENIHRKYWAKILENEFNESKPLYSAVVMDGCLNIIWHLFAARAYYVDIFLATHDIKAFLEYLYHRVSAVRVITLLITILEQVSKREKQDKIEFWKDLNTHCENLPDEYKNIHQQTKKDSFVWAILTLGIFDPIKQDIEKNLDGLTDIDQLLNYFRMLRQNSLSTLLMALNKNELLLRIEAAPNTVLAWSNQFLDFELKSMEQIDARFPIASDDPAVATLKELIKKFTRLKHQSLRSKMNYRGALELSIDTDIDSIERIEDLAHDKFKKLKTLLDKDPKKSQSVDNDITKDEEFKNIEVLFDIALCLVEPSNEKAEKVTYIICEELSKINNDPKIEKWLKKQLQMAYELHCRAKFKSTFWQPLLNRQEVIPNNKELEDAERYSVLYENLIRETTQTNNEDAKRRSTALTIRARALYLRGYFSQAHHFLDLSTTGLFSEDIDHWVLLGIANIVRAELLAISANQHYFSLSKEYDQVLVKLEKKNSKYALEDLPEEYNTFFKFSKAVQPIAASSLKKIKRAERELAQAEKLFQNIAHQNIWLIHMEFGWAQVQIEKLLFEVELLFLSWPSLNVTEYIKKSGELEQAILDTMKRIRNVFDILPYQSRQWNEIIKNRQNEVEASRSMTNLERNTLKLWRQLYVVGFYYSRLLGHLYKNKNEDSNIEIKEIPYFEKYFISALFRPEEENEDIKYLEQWVLWCTSMRFDVFKGKKNMDSFAKGVPQKKVNLKSISFRARIIEGMLNECSEEKIDAMWDVRRTNET